MTRLGHGELFDILAPLAAEVDDKRKEYEELRDKFDGKIGEYFSSKYGIGFGDTVYEAGSGQELRFERFIANRERYEDGTFGPLSGSINRRPFIWARAIHPFGLAKPKKYFPQDWIAPSEREMKKS